MNRPRDNAADHPSGTTADREPASPTVLVSSCLLGLATRYDGTDNLSPEVMEYLQASGLIPIPVCPEQLAGLPTPRPKCWFSQGDGDSVLDGTGKLCDENHQDVTDLFREGARECLKIARLTGSKIAILQQRSPSCGSRKIYRNEVLLEGTGVTAALLKRSGLKIFSDDHLPAEKP